MLIFILSAAKTMRLLSSHILPRNASDFTCRYLQVDLKNFPREKLPDPYLQKAEVGEGIKGSSYLYRKGRGRHVTPEGL